MADEPDLAALRERLADEIAAARLQALISRRQTYLAAQQLTETRATLAETRLRLDAAREALRRTAAPI